MLESNCATWQLNYDDQSLENTANQVYCIVMSILPGAHQDKFKSKGTELAEDQLAQMSKQLQVFQENLQQFAAKHKSE